MPKSPVRTRPAAVAVASIVLLASLAACGRGGGSPTPENPAASAQATGDQPGSGSTGVTADTIKIGGSFPFSGGLAIYGNLSKGLAAYFGKVNGEGGVNGRKIDYIALDDGYDPSRVASNARKLVEQDRVFAFAGFGGTNLTIRDYMKSKGVPQFVMAGNAPLSDVKTYPATHAWWPDIRLEGAITAKTVLKENPNAKIGALGLDNDITASQVEGIKEGLDGHSDQLVAQEVFPPTAQDLTSQMNRLKAAGVDTIISGIDAPTRRLAPTRCSTSLRRDGTRRSTTTQSRPASKPLSVLRGPQPRDSTVSNGSRIPPTRSGRMTLVFKHSRRPSPSTVTGPTRTT